MAEALLNTIQSIAIDSNGNAYLTGTTQSTDFPLQNPIQSTNHSSTTGASDAFILKLNASGSALLYSTYLGGSGDESGSGIAVDSSGNAYVTGATHSSDFPVQNPLPGVAANLNTVYITKLNAAGSALVYSTLLGGSEGETPGGIAVDASGSAYVTGSTISHDFPLKNPIQATNHGYSDIFVSKLNPAGSALIYSTYLGGSDFDLASGIAVDNNGCAYITGNTNSTDFPLQFAFQATNQGPISTGYAEANEAFVSKLNADGTALDYSTYLGGSGIDRSNGIAVDSAGSAYVTGWTTSAYFPRQNPLQPTYHGGNGDAFVSKLTPDGRSLAFSSHLGGTDMDSGSGIAVDNNKCIYVVGFTGSYDFPTQNAFQGINNARGGSAASFITKISPANIIDFNGDHKADLIFQNASSNQVAVWFMNGPTFLSQQNISQVPSAGWKVVGQGIFNYADQTDLLFQNVATNQAAIWYLQGTSLNGGAYVSPTVPAGWNIATSGDFNNDGLCDLILQNTTTNQIAIWYMNLWWTQSGNYVSLTPPAGWKVVGEGDFNGDGKPDLVLQNTTSNQVAIWYMDGATVLKGEYVSLSPPSGSPVVGVGDFNGDGKPDLVLQNAATNQVSFWYMNGSVNIGNQILSPIPASGWHVVGPR